MNLGEYLEKWGRTLFEAPLAAIPAPPEPPELAEIRLAVLDQVREKSYPSGGRKVFPFDLLRVDLQGIDEATASVFQGNFFRQYLEHEVRDALRNAGCRFPDNLRLTVHASPDLPKPGEPWLTVDAALQQNGQPATPARLVVRAGTANVAELPLEKSRTNIGRAADVVRSQGIFRRNDLVFSDDTEISRSVSREHAHILFDKTAGEYRLFNDRWYALGSPNCSTWILRDGLSHEVPRNGRGTKLEPGDEIHFGQAVVIFEK
jgi:hypothetical protein